MRIVTFVTLIVLSLFLLVSAEGSVTAQQLLNVLSKGQSLTGNIFDSDKGYLVSLKTLNTNVIFFQADMDIDCDGVSDNICNANTDDAFQSQTSAGGNIHASQTPFFVFPEPHAAFDYSSHGFGIGSVAAIIYNNQVIYAPFLDECGDVNDNGQYLIGEASYAAATLLGIDHNPNTGGADNGVTYIIFTGSSGQVSNYTDHNQAISVGNARATQLINAYAVVLNNKTPALSKVPQVFEASARTVFVKVPGAHSVEVFTSGGKRVMALNGEGKKKYDLSSLQPGLYLVKVQASRQTQTGRIILY